MKIYEVVLDGRQYSKLDFMVSSGTSIHMARNHLISGYDLFYDLIDYIYMPVADELCTLETMLNESEEQLTMLRFLTKLVYPEDEDYFVRQIGKKYHCARDFAFKIILKF